MCSYRSFKCFSVLIIFVTCVNSWHLKFLDKYYGVVNEFYENRYLNVSEISDYLRKIEREYPTLAKVHEIGRSALGQSILALEITSNVTQERSLLKPMFKFVANIHGDEAAGILLVLFLAKYLVLLYGETKEITSIVDSTDIFLVPTLNPDGYLVAVEGQCTTLPDDVGRNNANGVDLDRDFPGPDKESFDNMDDKQPETRAIINWILNNPFVLSGNFQAGAILVRFPYDDNYGNTPNGVITPDNELFRYLAESYTSHNSKMHKGDYNPNIQYENGVTVGANRSQFEGGMQDFNYIYTNCFEITIDVDICKFPSTWFVTSTWTLNRDAMLNFMKSVHIGIKGLIYGENGEPISGARVNVEGIDHPVTSTSRGEFWRLLIPGNYSIFIEAPNYETSYAENVVVNEGVPTIVNFTLKALT